MTTQRTEADLIALAERLRHQVTRSKMGYTELFDLADVGAAITELLALRRQRAALEVALRDHTRPLLNDNDKRQMHHLANEPHGPECCSCRGSVTLSLDALTSALLSAIEGGDGQKEPQQPALPEHICGLMGWNPMIDPPCPRCEWQRKRREGEDGQ